MAAATQTAPHEHPVPVQTMPAPEHRPLTREEKATQTTIARGETLLSDGYRGEPYADRPGVYAVYRPEGRPVKAGEAIWYDVDIINQTCDCAAFANLGTCKHLRGMNKAVAAAVALVAPMLPVEPVRGFGSREEFEARRKADFD